MTEKKTRAPIETPQNCPKCGGAPVVWHKGSKWSIRCSAFKGLFSECQTVGHTMFTKREAVVEWNKLTAAK